MTDVIVYGLGNYYEVNQEWIHKNYNVVGYSDRNPNKHRELFVKCEELPDVTFDKLLVAIQEDKVNVFHYIVDLLGIPKSKVQFVEYEHEKYRSDSICFHGQYLDDAFIELILRKMNLSIKGLRYLEIGTNDPVYINSTFNLYKGGARGVLVDPLPEVEDLISMIRPEDRFVNAIVSDKSYDELITFYRSEKSVFSAIDKNRFDFFDNAGIINKDKYEVVQCRQVSVNEILADMEESPNLLLVDAEGEDKSILMGIDYNQYKIDMIVSEGYDEEMLTYLNSYGYEMVYVIDGNKNNIFVKNEYLRYF